MENCRSCRYKFPCLECAENIFHGKKGPGYEFGRKIIYPSVSERIYSNMKIWMRNNPSEEEIVDLKNQKL